MKTIYIVQVWVLGSASGLFLTRGRNPQPCAHLAIHYRTEEFANGALSYFLDGDSSRIGIVVPMQIGVQDIKQG